MKLNAEIIYAHLSKYYRTEIHGNPSKRMALARPVFYMEHQRDFRTDHLYVASADHLPPYPQFHGGVVIICIGESLNLSYYYNRCTVISIKERCDYFSVYLTVQQIFDHFDTWNDELFELFQKDADIQKILECSSKIFEKPLIAIDQDFRFLATVGTLENRPAEKWKDKSEFLSQYSIKNYLEENEPKINERNPMFLKIIDSNALCVNLYDKKESYIGCLCMLVSEDSYAPGTDALIAYLARILERSIDKNPSILATKQNTVKDILKDLIIGIPISPNQRWLLNDFRKDHQYRCVAMHALNRENPLPASYICNQFEAVFPGGMAFYIDAVVIGIIDVDYLPDSQASEAQLDDMLLTILNSMKFCAGISNLFSDLDDVQIYYRQAEAAIKNGSMMDPQKKHYYFTEYALTEMVINSLSGFPIETYFPDGLKELLVHDEGSAVSYLETLKVFLDENMSYAKTAQTLFVHRSTLIDRITRIERDLDIDLKDPEKRLYIHLLLKAMEIKKSIRTDL